MLFIFLKLKSQTWLITLAPLFLPPQAFSLWSRRGMVCPWHTSFLPSYGYLLLWFENKLEMGVRVTTFLCDYLHGTGEKRVPTGLLVWADSTSGWWPLCKWCTCEVFHWTPLCLKCSQSPSALLRGNLSSSMSPWHDFKYQETWF